MTNLNGIVKLNYLINESLDWDQIELLCLIIDSAKQLSIVNARTLHTRE